MYCNPHRAGRKGGGGAEEIDGGFSVGKGVSAHSGQTLPNRTLVLEPQDKSSEQLASFSPPELACILGIVPQRGHADSKTCSWPWGNVDVDARLLDGGDAVA